MSICPSCGSSKLQPFTEAWRDEDGLCQAFISGSEVHADFEAETATRCRDCRRIHATYREVR